MTLRKRIGVFALAGLALAGCAAPAKKRLVDPFPLRFPLVEAGALEIEGHVVGQPRAQNGIVYVATRDGLLTAVVAPAGGILWRFKADRPLSAGPELGNGHIIIRDAGNTIYVLGDKGEVVLKKSLDEAASTAIRESEGRVFFGTSSGRIVALDVSAGGAVAWDYQTASAITAGPIFGRGQVLFGTAGGRLVAFDMSGRRAWEFAADGGIEVDPAVHERGVFFGTVSRFFYRLDAMTGTKKWSRRLQGASLYPPAASGNRVAFTASNSVVYVLSAKGGSVLWWEAVPSRIVFEPAAARGVLLVASASPEMVALDLPAGKRAGRHRAASPLAAGALWIPPFVVLLEENADSGLQRLSFLRAAPVAPDVSPHAR